jgi:hypothetical protein
LPFLRSRRGALPSPRRLQQIVLLAHSSRLLGLAAAAAERVEHACRAGGWGSERRAAEEAGPAVRCVGRPRGGLRDVKMRSLGDLEINDALIKTADLAFPSISITVDVVRHLGGTMSANSITARSIITRGVHRVDRASASRRAVASITRASSTSSDSAKSSPQSSSRRLALSSIALVPAIAAASKPKPAIANVDGPFCDFTQTLPCDDYPGYARTSAGLLYKEIRYGEGAPVTKGKEVVVDWDGYTFYLSHVIQARNLPKGGDFTGENEEAFLRFTPGTDRAPTGTFIYFISVWAIRMMTSCFS